MLVAFSVSPGGVGESVGDYVAEVVRLVRGSGLPNQTTSMFTYVEGDWDEIQDLIGRCIERVEEMGAPRVGVVVKIDHRPGRRGMLSAKVDAVEQRLRDDEGEAP